VKLSRILPILFSIVCVLSLLLAPLSAVSAQGPTPPDLPDPDAPAPDPNAPAAPAAPTVAPDAIYLGDLSRYTLAYPALYTYTGTPPCPPNAAEGAPDPAAPTAASESLARTPAYGGPERVLWSRPPLCNHSDVLSNIETDGQYLYWISATQGGLVRLSKDANPGDTPTLITTQVKTAASLDYYVGQIYILADGVSGVYAVNTTTLAFQTAVALACFNCGMLTVTNDYYYWLDGGDLVKYTLSDHSFKTVHSGISSYYALDYYVWYPTGNSVVLYIPWAEQHNPVYYSADPNATAYEAIEANNQLFILEQRPLNCYPFACYTYALVRTGWDGSGPDDVIYTTNTPFPHHLSGGGGFVFWQETSRVNRLVQSAAALPVVNLTPTEMEITQAIQNPSNAVQMVAGKRTFVRVTALASGSAVPGVTAYLYLTNADGGILAGPLVPVNSVGPRLTVPTTADRGNLNRSFLFELPWDWLSGTIYLKARINPEKVPLEPNYGDNEIRLGPIAFRPSPRLPLQFVGFGYDLGGTTYYPHFRSDVVLTYSYIRRTYPLSSAPGFISDGSPGFRPNLWLIFDDGLGSRVNQTAKECASLGNLCASAYVNGLLRTMRTEEGLDSSIFMYGMISDRGGFFPRGQEGGASVSSGPAGTPNTANGNFLGGGWDFDLTYGDWYAAHEVGHSLGRGHPVPASDDPATPKVTEGCGHSRTDAGYTYPNAEISPSGGNYQGFDAGDGEFGLAARVIAGTVGHDFMSYCNEQWISDYTYNGIYARLTSPTNAPTGPLPRYGLYAPTRGAAAPKLTLAGVIFPDTASAVIQHLRRLETTAAAVTPGAFAVRLLNAAGTSLGQTAFAADPISDAPTPALSFGLTVDFAAGTRRVQIVRLSDGAVLTEAPISASAPTVSGVSVSGSAPLTGTVTLSWDAVDPDGDALTYDIHYSMDGGTTFQPLRYGVGGTSAAIDTSALGGTSGGVFRVVASDGANTAQADSAPVAVAVKPPQVAITLPADQLHVQWGQLVNFSGEAFDPQDGSLGDTSLEWSLNGVSLGYGALLSKADLPVGTNVLTLGATDSAGQSAAATVTVIVGDELAWPGPILSAGPSEIGWHVGAGATAPQTAELTVANVGGGSLTWTAVSSAPWLTLSATSGSAPATLTLTADPTGLPAGATASASVTISSPEGGADVVIPVSLGVGAVWTHTAERWTWLPMVAR
jgi:hypothetical protein